jgi:hypothetical protein
MKKIESIIFCILLAISNINAADIIVTRKSEKISAKILEVAKDQIKYKKVSNINGPTFIISTSDIQTILYDNGEVQIFTDSTSDPKNSSSVSQQDKNIGSAHKVNGLYVFSDCEPICKYTIIGREKSMISWTGQYNEIRSKLVKKAVKDFPNAEGLVTSFSKEGTDRSIAIEFKTDNANQDVSLCKVNTINGLLVFTDCEPVKKYHILGHLSKFIGLSGEYEAVRNSLVKKATKHFPSAEGIICTFSTDGIDRAVAIAFDE